MTQSITDTANTWQPQVALHALATLETGNLACIPVYAGATWPLLNTPKRFQAWEFLHGKLPWEGAFAPENLTAEAQGSDPTSGNPNRISPSALLEGMPNTTVAKSTNGANFMVEMVHKYPGQVSIYSAGALTNVALAVRSDPEFASLAKELVIMGGYVDVNMFQAVGTYNEADVNSDINLMIDPEASKIALTADFPEIVIAGNVANQVNPTQDFLDEVYDEVKNRYTQLFHDYYELTLPYWDETAAAIMVDPSIVVNKTHGELSPFSPRWHSGSFFFFFFFFSISRCGHCICKSKLWKYPRLSRSAQVPRRSQCDYCEPHRWREAQGYD